MYQVLIERKAEKDLEILPAKIFQKVSAKIQQLANNPRPQGSQKLRNSDDNYRIRIGDYRVLYEIDGQDKVVKIFRVKIRGQAYR